MGRASLAAAVCYCAILLFWCFRVVTWTAAKRSTNDKYPELSELLNFALPCAAVLILLHLLIRTKAAPIAKVAVVRKARWSEKEYLAKLDRFGSATFKALFFIIFTCYAYVVLLRDAAWVPPALFGSGSVSACWGPGNSGEAQDPPSDVFKQLYQIAMAYHLSEFAFQILFELSKPDLVEMLVHHSTTCALIFSSFYMNYMRIGSLVLFIHYISDIPVYLTKIFVDSSLKIATLTCYVGCLVSWAWLRLYVFPRHVIVSVIFEGAGEIPVIGEHVYAGFITLLGLLLCLHVYWYMLFLQIGWHLLKTGKTVDMQAKIGTKKEQLIMPEQSENVLMNSTK